MARTVRKKLKGKGKARDGEDLRPSRSCRHHGSCAWCVEGRQHSNKRRIPA